MNELKMDGTAVPTFLLKTAPRQQAEELDAFRDAVRKGDTKWIVADYPADRACTLADCMGTLLARLQCRVGKIFVADR